MPGQSIIHSLLVTEFDKSYRFLLLIEVVDRDLNTYYLSRNARVSYVLAPRVRLVNCTYIRGR